VVFCPCASPLASMAWFLQFRIKACVGLTPPIRRLPPAQSSGSSRACPRRQHHPWFRQLLISNDASSKGLLTLVFPTLTCPGSCPGLCTRRSPPRLFTAAARAGLRPAPESRSRGACPHLLCSFTTRISFHLLLLPCFCSTHAVPLSLTIRLILRRIEGEKVQRRLSEISGA
jgi:hypothetical protein